MKTMQPSPLIRNGNYFGVRHSNSSDFSNGPHGKPAPKPSQTTHREPTEGEWAAWGKRQFSLRHELIDLANRQTEKKREIDDHFASMHARAGGEVIAECDFCHERHLGICN